MQTAQILAFKAIVHETIEENDTIKELKSDVSQLKADVAELKADVKTLKEEVRELKIEVHRLGLLVEDLQGAVQRLLEVVSVLIAKVDRQSGHDETLSRLGDDIAVTRQVLAAHISDRRIQRGSGSDSR